MHLRRGGSGHSLQCRAAFNVVQLNAFTLVEQARVSVPVPNAPRDPRFVASTQICASGRYVAATRNDSVLLFDTLTFGSGSGYLTLKVDGACCSAFSPDERLLAVAGRFQRIRFFDVLSISLATAAATAGSESRAAAERDVASAALLHSEPPLRASRNAVSRLRVLGLIYVPPSYNYIEWVSQTHVVAVTATSGGGYVTPERRTVDLISVPLNTVISTYYPPQGSINTAGFSRDRRSVVLLDSQVTASVVCLKIGGSELAPVAEDESSIVLDEAALAQPGAHRDGKKCLVC
jgi:hypothetical protein